MYINVFSITLNVEILACRKFVISVIIYINRDRKMLVNFNLAVVHHVSMTLYVCAKVSVAFNYFGNFTFYRQIKCISSVSTLTVVSEGKKSTAYFIPSTLCPGCIISCDIYVGLYCSGWVKTGPVGVILTTMSNAFETAEAIVDDYDKGIYNKYKKK